MKTPADWVERMLAAPPVVSFPSDLQAIVVSECIDWNKPIPNLRTKYVGWEGFMGGYTSHGEGEIVLVYGIRYQKDNEIEIRTVLHELAHYIIGHEDGERGGHTPRFYSTLVIMALKWGLNMLNLIEDESDYVGADNVVEGISLFDNTYNEGTPQ